MSRIFVVVASNPFSESMEGVPFPLHLGRVMLTVTEPDSEGSSEMPWEEGLRDNVKQVLLAMSQREALRAVRVVAHLGCFGVKDPFVFQDRLKEKEEELRRETGAEDLQVWGFRHDPGKPINDALVAIVKAAATGSTAASGTVLGEQLESVFLRSAAHDLYEELSITRHRIFRPLVAIRLNLEHAAELSAINPSAAAALYSAATKKLEEKLAEARAALHDQAAAIGKHAPTLGEAVRHRIEFATELLARGPELNKATDHRSAALAFSEWLGALDEGLNRLRDAVK